MPRLTRSFFDRPVLEVAPELLGVRLHPEIDGVVLEGAIVEVEAYLGDGSDPASHAHGGRTARNASMFGPPAHFYVYRSMGIHTCINVVCEPSGRAAGVLIRAIEPLRGIQEMARHRGGRTGHEIGSGPGKLTQALGIALEQDGVSALRGSLRLAPPAAAPGPIRVSPRIGISKARELPYRFFVQGSPHVSRSPLNARGRAIIPHG